LAKYNTTPLIRFGISNWTSDVIIWQLKDELLKEINCWYEIKSYIERVFARSKIKLVLLGSKWDWKIEDVKIKQNIAKENHHLQDSRQNELFCTNGGKEILFQWWEERIYEKVHFEQKVVWKRSQWT